MAKKAPKSVAKTPAKPRKKKSPPVVVPQVPIVEPAPVLVIDPPTTPFVTCPKRYEIVGGADPCQRVAGHDGPCGP